MRMIKSNLYSTPQKTKECCICGKQIDAKYKDNICLRCRDNLELHPIEFKDIAEIFNSHPKGDGGVAKWQRKQNEK